ncbi:hypothetical protein [Clostridioides difficile]|uniref:hypothetical protein n=1 Tax=Clostridioides difficile TaxID=1496 RepID=UPI001883E705|nr:hypothetical protein [Clostridioides difficile]
MNTYDIIKMGLDATNPIFIMSYVFTLTPPQNIFYLFCLLIKNEVAILQKRATFRRNI